MLSVSVKASLRIRSMGSLIRGYHSTQTIMLRDPSRNQVLRMKAWEFKKALGNKVPEYAENMFRRRQLQREDDKIHRDTAPKVFLLHEMKRQKIVTGQVDLSYRETQRLCKLNELKCTGAKEVLENRLLTFSRRMDPENIKKSTNSEVRSIRWNLDSFEKVQEKTQTERNQELAAELEDEDMRRNRGDLLRKLWFLADLAVIDTEIKEKQEYENAKKRVDSVMGKYFCAPSPTSRACCRRCGEKIEKDSARVTEHSLTRFYGGKHSGGSWSVRHTERHFHASCFVEEPNKDDPKTFTKNAKIEELDDLSLKNLRDEIVSCNETAQKDKEYQRLRKGPVVRKYPANVVLFGYEADKELVYKLR